MPLFTLLALIMGAFAANSVLTRLGVGGYGMAPLDFALLRTAAGAGVLWVIVALRARALFRPALSARRVWGALALAVYMLGFSAAYQSLDSGLGALILFGVLQIVIFAWAVASGERIPLLRWWGATLAFCGLCLLLWPAGPTQVPVAGAAAMAAAGTAWALYTLLGAREADPLRATADNFLLCLPVILGAALLSGTGTDGKLHPGGVGAALIAGGVTSGLGYALWYRVLPGIPATTAGIAQLSVPVITAALGAAFLAEPLGARLLISAALVLGGIALALFAGRRVF